MSVEFREGPTTPVAPVVHLSVVHEERINLAHQQLGLPLVSELTLTNQGAQPLSQLRVVLRLSPDVAPPVERRLDDLQPGSEHRFESIGFDLSSDVLGGLQERVTGRLTVEVIAGDTRVGAVKRPIHLYAHNEWPGLGTLPELIAAFVRPNAPALPQWLRMAADKLEEWTGSASLDGYQSRDPERARAIAAAMYAALQQYDVTYVNPPASFESQGQKIRTAEAMAIGRMGTCLDLAVLVAGLLEQAGLHPLVVLVDGHAVTGVWLMEDRFPEPAQSEPLKVLKRVELGEIAVFDPTAITERRGIGFEESERIGRRHVEDTERFVVAIDVRTARAHGIHPLADGSAEVGPVQASKRENITTAPAPSAQLAASRRVTVGAAATSDDDVGRRLDRWRARLLNHRDGKSSIPLLVGSAATLSDDLASGLKLTLRSKPGLTSSGSPDQDALVVERFLEEERRARNLRTTLADAELDKRATHLFRQSRLTLEEGGANTLFVTAGTVEWYQAASSDQPRFSPILLLPARLSRTRAGGAITVELLDEEPSLNVTLLQMLRDDHGIEVTGLDPVPVNEGGVDIELVLATFRQALRDQDRWRVRDEATLGLFTFSKFLMWRDLTDRFEELRKSRIVRNIVERTPLPAEMCAAPPAEDEIEDAVDPVDLLCPLDADPSQLRAVVAAAGKTSYVLQGPPGTGKSQTITNLVVNCLAGGKRVLFVSEKMAALNVVHDRLAAVGLGPFCLELHSNKASKSEVLQQFKEALAVAGRQPPGEWRSLATRLRETRRQLRQYVEAIGRKHPVGLSVFKVTAALIKHRETPAVPVTLPTPAKHWTAERLREAEQAVERMATAAGEVAPVHEHPLRELSSVRWEPGCEQQLDERLAGLERSAGELQDATGALASRLGADPAAIRTAGDHALVEQACALLRENPELPRSLLAASPWGPTRQRVEALVETGRARSAAWGPLSTRWKPELLSSARLDELLGRFQRWADAFVLIAWLMLFSARKALRGLAAGGTLPKARQTRDDLVAAVNVRKHERALQEQAQGAAPLLGPYWRGTGTDWAQLTTTVERCEALRRLRASLVEAGLDGWASRIEHLATDGGDALRGSTELRAALDHYCSARQALCEAQSAVEKWLGAGAASWEGAGSWPEAVRRAANRWRESLDDARAWSAYLIAREQVVQAGFQPLVEALERGQVSAASLPELFQRSWRDAWLGEVTRADAVLREFSGVERERQVEQFRELDRRCLDVAAEEAVARLAARVPPPGAPRGEGSELEVLLRQLNLKRRHMPIRKLFRQIPTLLARLKPCLLMSPLSVAQYLDPELENFDLVVFDEASQIPVWEALGAIGRGDQLIVVGDAKQLPPTNFFSKMESDEVLDEDDFEEMESILDECSASGMLPLRLRWHYRSRHEDLITFSNHHYYERRLMTFPSPAAEVDHLGVEWRHVPEGFYDRGKSRTNPAEAEALVAEIRRRVMSDSSDTIGVVTFSTAQQILVSDLLDKACQDDPLLDQAINALAESLFVKNLENVQGDERDVMLFSICYGPDPTGRVAMNFGPLNRPGGERRLNVAVTRARKKTITFSTLTPDQIDLRRSRALGVAHLKSYLRYAARGPEVLPELETAPRVDADSPFELDVEAAIHSMGYQTARQVGCSGYRIDLAVVDPENPGRYVLGVECDGAQYHSSRSARERDRLRHQMLEQLGWRLHRVWSTDWWHDRMRQLAKLRHAIEQALKTPRPEASQPAPRAAEVRSAPPPTAAADLDQVVVSYGQKQRKTQPSSFKGGRAYQPFLLDPVPWDSDAFYDAEHAAFVRGQIRALVVQEGPLSLDLAFSRLADAWGARVTRRFRERVDELLREAVIGGDLVPRNGFLWPPAITPASLKTFRMPLSDDEHRREADDLPPEEIANAALALLAHGGATPRENLLRDVARIFGFARLGHRVEAALATGLDLLVSTGRATVKDDAYLPTE